MGVEGKRKQRGKNSALRRYLRKKGEKNIIDEKRLKFEEMRKERAKRQQGLPSTSKAEELGPALSRFLQPGAK
jgi:U3 small nucleolar RNA-associated protein 7